VTLTLPPDVATTIMMVETMEEWARG